ncbi:cyclodeaminase/cyclohydrolase family protein [Neorhizobium alkalisoli]|uniref:cyclodeaminase/cyclohydrolase family protein n=1 Tax=Neorhizobium alkalisoli TaxID=528178 RepID=UPI000CF8D994|nr:cyclodeaminase/cyclohydrolase family protein [Neorhizobium alkalisoli]
MEMFNQRLSAILQVMGRRSPPLGGGAASLLSGLIGLSLIRMAAEITRPESNAAISRAVSRLDELARLLKESAKADVDVFNEYVAALKLPRDEPEEMSKREEVLAEAGLRAAETPLSSAFLLAKAPRSGSRYLRGNQA